VATISAFKRHADAVTLCTVESPAALLSENEGKHVRTLRAGVELTYFLREMLALLAVV